MSQNNNKSYRIKVDVNSTEQTKIPVKLDRDYNLIEILSLKIKQEDLYRLHSSDYGVVVGRVLANGGVGVENAKISVFIPVNEETKEDIEKYLIYPFETTHTKNRDGVRYNLLPANKLDNCYQNVGTFPSKRVMLDNNSVLEVFDEYYKYTTVTNQAGDYMIYGLPINENLIHVDIDLSDIGVLSQKPYDFFYKGYNIEQFDSASQFRKDTNLDGLTQILTQDKPVFVYPFWGDSSETETAITRCDISISYKFEPTCVFMGSIFTDTQDNVMLKNCGVTREIGRMASLTTGSGKIEMIRKTFDGIIEDYPINGNRLIDGEGVWCYQIPMNLDYVTTDEFGNLVPTDNPNKGIPTRADVRFRISLDNVGDESTSKKRGEYLIPHNPQSEGEYDFVFGSETKDTSFVTLMWNKVYSVKSYIPRVQLSPNHRNRSFLGIKTINTYGDKNPFPYNNMTIKMSMIFILLCMVSNLIINLVNWLNGLISQVRCNSWIGWVFNGIQCIYLDRGWCETMNKDRLLLNCTCDKAGENNDFKVDKDKLMDCVAMGLGGENEVYNFNFINDWVNGTLYSPLFQTKIRKKKVRKFLGLFGGKVVSETLSFCGTIESDENVARGSWLFGRGVDRTRLYTNCVSELYRSGNTWRIRTGQNNNNCYKKRCVDETRQFMLGKGFINQITDINNDKHFYYIPSILSRVGSNYSYPVLLFATDIILLGSMDECDIDGIFPLHKILPPTTFNMPSIMKETNEVEGSEKTESTGIGWGIEPGPDQIPTNKNVRLYNNLSGGLFLSINCLGTHTFQKTCFNLARISELGVSLDESTVIEKTCSNDNSEPIVVPPDGWILKKDELIQSEVRQMFATLNSIPFYNRIDDTHKNIIEVGGRRVYNFKYYYPENFDGKMYPFINNDVLGNPYNVNNLISNAVNRNNEIVDEDYLNFRFGENDHHVKYYGSYSTMPRYVNSFYFYFGLYPGKTAIDKFKNKFFSDCVSSTTTPFVVQAKVTNHALVHTCTNYNENVKPVIIDIVIRENTGTYTIDVSDENGVSMLNKKQESDRTIRIISCQDSDNLLKQRFNANHGIPQLNNGGNFVITITDTRGVRVTKQITVNIYGHVDFDYTTKHITLEEEYLRTESDNYIGTQTPFNDYYKGKIYVENISNILNKGCTLNNYDLVIKHTDNDNNVTYKTYKSNSGGEWKNIIDSIFLGNDIKNKESIIIKNGGSGYSNGVAILKQGDNQISEVKIGVSNGVINTITNIQNSPTSNYLEEIAIVKQSNNETAKVKIFVSGGKIVGIGEILLPGDGYHPADPVKLKQGTNVSATASVQVYVTDVFNGTGSISNMILNTTSANNSYVSEKLKVVQVNSSNQVISDNGIVSVKISNGKIAAINEIINYGNGYNSSDNTYLVQEHQDISDVSNLAKVSITTNNGVITSITNIDKGGSDYIPGEFTFIQGSVDNGVGVFNNTFTIHLWEGYYEIKLVNTQNSNDVKQINELIEYKPPVELVIRGNNQDIRPRYFAINKNINFVNIWELDEWWRNFYKEITSPTNNNNDILRFKQYYLDKSINTKESVENIKSNLRNVFINTCNDNHILTFDAYGDEGPYKPYIFGKKQIDKTIIKLKDGGSGYSNGNNELVVVQGLNNTMIVNVTIENVNEVNGRITRINSVTKLGEGYKMGEVRLMDMSNPNNISAIAYINAPQAQGSDSDTSYIKPVMTNESIITIDNSTPFPFTDNGTYQGINSGGYFVGIVSRNGYGEAWNREFDRYLNKYRQENTEKLDMDIYSMYLDSLDTDWFTFIKDKFFYFRVWDRRLMFYKPFFRTISPKSNFLLYSINDGIIETKNYRGRFNLIYFNGNTDNAGVPQLPNSDVNNPILSINGVDGMLPMYDIVNSQKTYFLFKTNETSSPVVRGIYSEIDKVIEPTTYTFTMTDTSTSCGEIKQELDMSYNISVENAIIINPRKSNEEDNIPGITSTALIKLKNSIEGDIHLLPTINQDFLPHTTGNKGGLDFCFLTEIDDDPYYYLFKNLTLEVGKNKGVMNTMKNVTSAVYRIDDNTNVQTIVNFGTEPLRRIFYDGDRKYETLDNMSYYLFHGVGISNQGVRDYTQPLALSKNRLILKPFSVTKYGESQVGHYLSFEIEGYTNMQMHGYDYSLRIGTWNRNYTNLEDFFIPNPNKPIYRLRNPKLGLEVKKILSGTDMTQITNVTLIDGGIGVGVSTSPPTSTQTFNLELYYIQQHGHKGSNPQNWANIYITGVDANGTVTSGGWRFFANDEFGNAIGKYSNKYPAYALYNRFDKINIDRNDINEIVEVNATNAAGVTLRAYTSFYRKPISTNYRLNSCTNFICNDGEYFTYEVALLNFNGTGELKINENKELYKMRKTIDNMSKEKFLAEGWGTESDLAHLAFQVVEAKLSNIDFRSYYIPNDVGEVDSDWTWDRDFSEDIFEYNISFMNIDGYSSLLINAETSVSSDCIEVTYDNYQPVNRNQTISFVVDVSVRNTDVTNSYRFNITYRGI